MDVTKYLIQKQKDLYITKEMHPTYGSGNYCLDVKDNLITEMAEEHVEQYGGGSGGEMKPKKEGEAAKMAALRSSSAMTFNLVGNYGIRIKDNPFEFALGDYKVEYEKQMRTLAMSLGRPANLDALLTHTPFEKDKEAIFCEMKMMEWHTKPSKTELDEKYKEEAYYFLKEAYEVFRPKIDQIKEADFQRYDACQMFKHTLAIFNATFTGNIDANVDLLEKQREVLQLHGKFKKITLANVVYQIPEKELVGTEIETKYKDMHEQEQKEFDKFKKIMLDNKLIELFKKKCGVDFDIVFIPTKDFIGIMEKSEAEKKYLERYWKL